MGAGAPVLSWSVQLPDRKGSGLGQSRPKGAVTIVMAGQDAERVVVPGVVARKLRSEIKGGGPVFSSRDDVLAHVREVSAACAHARMEGLVNLRDYSSKEMVDKLLLDGYEPEVVRPLVARAVEAGVIDDERFARVFVRTKIAAGWGQGKIVRELSRKGIEAERLDGWPHEFFEADDEAERAYGLVSRRRLTGKNDYGKLMRFLLSRGFSTGVASSAVRRVLDEADERE